MSPYVPNSKLPRFVCGMLFMSPNWKKKINYFTKNKASTNFRKKTLNFPLWLIHVEL